MNILEYLGISRQVVAERLFADFGVAPELFDMGDAAVFEIATSGVAIRVEEATERVSRVQLLSEAEFGYESYPRQLPLGLSFCMTAEGAQEHLGAPFKTGPGGPAPVLGDLAPWAEYWCGEYFVALRFGGASGTISMVAVEHYLRLSPDHSSKVRP